jgi:hypothetical protein
MLSYLESQILTAPTIVVILLWVTNPYSTNKCCYLTLSHKSLQHQQMLLSYFESQILTTPTIVVILLWVTNPYSTNKCTVLLVCISLRISCYMFRLNCHHHGANILSLNLQQYISQHYIHITNLRIKIVTNNGSYLLFIITIHMYMYIIICTFDMYKHCWLMCCCKFSNMVSAIWWWELAAIILVNDQLDAQFFFLICFISILYMFRATSCSSSGESIVTYKHKWKKNFASSWSFTRIIPICTVKET